MFSGRVGKAVVKLFMNVSLDGGDLFLLSGFKAEGCSKRFELESGYSFVGKGWLEPIISPSIGPSGVRSAKESDINVIDCGSLLKRVVTRDDDKVLSTEQFVVGLGFHSSAEASVWSIFMFMSARILLDEQPEPVGLCSCPNAFHDVSPDSLITALGLRALETWSVRPATVPDCKVTDCGFHVKRAVTWDVWLSREHRAACY